MKKALLMVLVGLALGSCQKKERHNLTFELDTPFQMTQGQTAECTCGDVSITLSHIDDSRCPTTVECFWAGMVTVDFDFNGAALKLGLNADVAAAPAIDTISNYAIELIQVNPYPQVPGDLEQADYTVTLKVTEVDIQ